MHINKMDKTIVVCFLLAILFHVNCQEYCGDKPLLVFTTDCKDDTRALSSFTLEPKPKNFKKNLNGQYRIKFSSSDEISVHSLKMGQCVNLEYLSKKSVRDLRGHFIESKLQGEVQVGLKNGTLLKLTLNEDGVICGVQEHFNEKNELVQVSLWQNTQYAWQKITSQLFLMQRSPQQNAFLLHEDKSIKVISCKNVHSQHLLGYECFEVEEKYVNRNNGFVQVSDEAPEATLFNLNLKTLQRIYLNEVEHYPKEKCQESSKDVFKWLEAMESDLQVQNHLKVKYLESQSDQYCKVFHCSLQIFC